MSTNQPRGGWATALYAYLDADDTNPDVYRCTEELVVIRGTHSPHQLVAQSSHLNVPDKFPKAKVHLLVMPRVKLPSFADLRFDHLTMLREMKVLGEQIVSDLKKEGHQGEFKLGRTHSWR